MSDDNVLVARYSLWFRLLVLCLSPIVLLVIAQIPQIAREPSFANVSRSLLVVTLWCAGFGEIFVRRTWFSSQSLTRRSAWGATTERDYRDVQELSVLEGDYLDIVFSDGSKWRVWSREAPLDLVRKTLLERVEAVRNAHDENR